MGRRRKLGLKGCLKGGNKKKCAKDVEGDNATAPNNDPAPTNAKGKKMIRDPITCKKYGEKGHRQASSKCPLNGTKKKRQLLFFLLQPLNHHVITNIIFLLVERGSSLERTIEKIIQIGLAPHKGQQENKYYGIVQEGQREGTK